MMEVGGRMQAPNNTILQATVGSEMFGLNISSSDRDEMGVCIEDLQAFVGFSEFEQYVLEANKGHELDLTIYSLKKYLRLCLKGNPTVLTLLFVPQERCLVNTYLGAELQGLAPKMWSKAAGRAFLGYLTAQRMRLLGERGGKDVNRPELVEKYGFDTKYAMHMLRLGFQGIEFMETGRMTLPMQERERAFLMNVRLGKVSLQECLTKCGELERSLKDLLDSNFIPEQGDQKSVEDWMLDVYYHQWKGHRG
jgi:predicted nucleotidyltransferase